VRTLQGTRDRRGRKGRLSRSPRNAHYHRG
jgi:hypothetical protein